MSVEAAEWRVPSYKHLMEVVVAFISSRMLLQLKVNFDKVQDTLERTHEPMAQNS